MGKFMISKFQGTCAESGAKIKKGDPIYFDGLAFCSYSNKYKKLNEIDDLAKFVESEQSAYFDNFCLKNNI